MNVNPATLRVWLVLLLLLAGCGGGSASSPPPPPPPPPPFEPEILFLASVEGGGQTELFATDLVGSEVRTISGPRLEEGAVNNAGWSPDRSLVAFTGDMRTDGLIEFFIVPVLGGPVMTLATPVARGYVGEFVFTPAGDRLVFRAALDAYNVRELYSVGIDGSGLTKLSGPISYPRNVAAGWSLSPDGSRVAYVADQDPADLSDELYTVAVDGTGRVKISGDLPTGGAVIDTSVAWRPDGSQVSYAADQDARQVYELYSAPALGGGTTKLSGALVPGGDVGQIRGGAWSPDGSRVAYIADQLQDNVVELFVASATGDSSVRVSGALIAGGGVYNDFRWSPDGTRILYWVTGTNDGVNELFVALADGTGATRVSGPVAPGATGVIWQRFEWSPDGARIAYLAMEDSTTAQDLYSVASDGTGHVRISDPADTTSVTQFLWSPDGTRLLLRSFSLVDNGIQLFVSPAGQRQLLRVTPVTGGRPSGLMVWTADGEHIAYGVFGSGGSGGSSQYDLDEVWTVGADGTNPLWISGPFNPASGYLSAIIVR